MSHKQVHRITIDATPEEVWRCLTEAGQTKTMSRSLILPALALSQTSQATLHA